MTELIKYYNEDCMIGMARYPDKHFDLAIVDPPYGLGDKLLKGGKNGNVVKIGKQYEKTNWVDVAPDKSYFDELFRVSSNQIIWGGNYFNLPPTRGIVAWDKNLGSPHNFSHFELAWTSFDCIARRLILSSQNPNRFHPTQKPVALYKWLLTNYAKEGDLILDTHFGSASSLIACHQLGFDAVGFELDPDYYKASLERLQNVQKQITFEELLG